MPDVMLHAQYGNEQPRPDQATWQHLFFILLKMSMRTSKEGSLWSDLTDLLQCLEREKNRGLRKLEVLLEGSKL